MPEYVAPLQRKRSRWLGGDGRWIVAPLATCTPCIDQMVGKLVDGKPVRCHEHNPTPEMRAADPDRDRYPPVKPERKRKRKKTQQPGLSVVPEPPEGT